MRLNIYNGAPGGEVFLYGFTLSLIFFKMFENGCTPYSINLSLGFKPYGGLNRLSFYVKPCGSFEPCGSISCGNMVIIANT